MKRVGRKKGETEQTGEHRKSAIKNILALLNLLMAGWKANAWEKRRYCTLQLRKVGNHVYPKR